MNLFKLRHYSTWKALIFLGCTIVLLSFTFTHVFWLSVHSERESAPSSKTNTLRVLLWRGSAVWAGFGEYPVWHRPNYVGQDVQKETCPVHCEFFENEEDVGTADAVVIEQIARGRKNAFEYLHHPVELPERRPGQVWVNFGYETELYFPILGEHYYVSQFAVNMSFDRRHSAVPITFACNWAGSTVKDYYERAAGAQLIRDKTKVAVIMASNCDRGGADRRTAYLKELMSYIPVHSYGGCFRNQQVPQSMQRPIYDDHGQSMADKEEIFRGYFFALAWENSNTTDYVSEKLYNAFLSGALPVYMGTSSVEDYLPGEHSIIRTDQFAGPRELAAHLTYLIYNRTAYEEYFAWRKNGVSEKFLRSMDRCLFTNGDCRLCKYLHELRQRRGVDRIDHWRPREVEELPSSAASIYATHALPLAIILDGQDQYIRVNTSARLGAFAFREQFTVSLWFHPYGEAPDGTIICRGNSVIDGGWAAYLTATAGGSFLDFCLIDRSLQRHCLRSNGTILKHTWTHVAFVYNSGTVRMYVNTRLSAGPQFLLPELVVKQHSPLILGGSCERRAANNPSFLYPAEPPVFSGNAPFSFYSGLLDDVSIWSKALDSVTIAKLAFQRLRGDEIFLEAYYLFNEEHGGDVAIDSTMGLHGHIFGAARRTRIDTKPMHFPKNK